VNRASEPHRNVLRGSQASVGWTRKPISVEKIRELAEKWKGLVEEQERIMDTRTERLKKEQEAKRRRQAREMLWERDWQHHKSETKEDYPEVVATANVAAIKDFKQNRRAKILDLTDDLTRPRTENDLLELAAADDDPENRCFCGDRYGERSEDPDVAQGIWVRFQGHGSCTAVFHRKCMITQLTNPTGDWLCQACPYCNLLLRFVLKDTYDDPKFRWVLEDPSGADTREWREHIAQHKLWQVSGYIPFQAGLNGRGKEGERDMKFFKPFDFEDRWGDLEAH
jgi:hypothetical protein